MFLKKCSHRIRPPVPKVLDKSNFRCKYVLFHKKNIRYFWFIVYPVHRTTKKLLKSSLFILFFYVPTNLFYHPQTFSGMNNFAYEMVGEIISG